MLDSERLEAALALIEEEAAKLKLFNEVLKAVKVLVAEVENQNTSIAKTELALNDRLASFDKSVESLREGKDELLASETRSPSSLLSFLTN